MATALIGLDWGTSALRAYRLGPGGEVLEHRELASGILKVEAGDFAGAFERAVGAWCDAAPAAPVLASGMITSRQGWVEVPYLACPAGLPELAAALHPHDAARGRIWFVPGLAYLDQQGVPDVMRGEETQIAGALADSRARTLLVLPGTHSKWAEVEAGRITWFATFMTGEVFGVLRAHSILGRLMPGGDDEDDPEAFARGLAYAEAGGSGLLKRLFSARTLPLFERLPARGVASYLSGLLIGTEIEEGLHLSPGATGAGIMVVGSSALARRYRAALEAKGLAAGMAPDDVAARGLFRIAQRAGLLP